MAMPKFEKIEGKRKGSVNFFHERFLHKKATTIPSKNSDAIDGEMAVKAQSSSKTINFFSNIKYQFEPEVSEVTKS